MLGKNILTVIVCLHLIICSASAQKTVFIISNHDNSYAQAYSIEGTQVDFQADVDISTDNPGVGPVGNAIWPEKELMFITYEDSPMIVWSSTKTLEKVGELNTEIVNYDGIAVDKENQKIYVVQRSTNHLYQDACDLIM
jgi:DNA-binding beta-propeller fold protein YncE